MSKSIYIILALFLMVSASAVDAAPSSLLSFNDITKKAKSNYLIGHNDPYFVFSHNAVEIGSSTQQYWYIPLQLAASTKQENIELEIFYDGKQTVDRPVFSARKYIKFEINTKVWQTANGIQIQIPQGLYFTDKSLLRLDINNCKSCELKLSGAASLSNEPLSAYATGTVVQVRRGISSPEQKVIDVALKNWSANHLDKDGNVTSADPFMVSPLLDTSTDNLAGIYFEVDYKSEQNSASLFQLFYATERHDFIEAASIYAKVVPSIVSTVDESLDNSLDITKKTKQQRANHAFRFYLPLDFLSKQNPDMEILERVRLDFSNKHSPWVLAKVQLVPESKKDKYLSYLPNQMVLAKLQKASGRQVIKNTLSRLSSDPGFIITYLFLILGLFYYLWRSYVTISRA